MSTILKPETMLTFRRLAVYLLTFIVAVGSIAAISNFWKSIDYSVYKTFYLSDAEDIKLRSDIHLIDLPYYAEGTSSFDRANYRQRITDLLKTIKTAYDKDQQPKAVVLDIFFTNDAVELENLSTALDSLKGKVKVYGVYDMRDHEEVYFEKHDAKQARILYENYFEGFRLHTMFDENMGILSYESQLPFKSEFGGEQLIESLASKVARDINVDDSELESRGYILPLGNEKSINDLTYQFTHKAGQSTGGTFSRDIDLDDKILIVGSLEEDQLTEINKTGTHLVAWALYDQLKGNQIAKQPINKIAIILAMVLFFSLFVVLIYALLYKYVKSLQTKPLVIAVLSFLIGVALLIGVGFVVLAMDKVMPLGLTLIGMLVASLLAWQFAKKFLVTGIAEGSGKYDVFISYSHGNYKWVKENIYNILKGYQKPDGSYLDIFFDENSIGIGEQFTIKYMNGIVDSKVFLPIFSEDYYMKNHCKNEMNLAIKRHVEKLILLKPIARKFEYVPDVFTHINLINVEVNENFMETLKEDFNTIFSA